MLCKAILILQVQKEETFDSPGLPATRGGCYFLRPLYSYSRFQKRKHLIALGSHQEGGGGVVSAS